MATGGTSPSVQRRHFMPETTKGPRRLPVRRDQPPQGEGRLATRQIVKMGIAGVPRAKLGGWRLVIDLKTINAHCQKRSMKMETLRHLRLIAKPEDQWVSFDLKDGFIALAIHPKDREIFTVTLNG